MITQEDFNKHLNRILKPRPAKIAVAVSGGCDSMAMTLLCNEWAKQYNIELVAITVDHNIRRNSAKEALLVHKWISSYNINHIVLTYTGDVPKSNIEAEARNYRYQMLFEYCAKNGIDYLCIAHNVDEQIETFFLNLARGSGLYGLCAMPELYTKQDIKLVRPMLRYSKDDIKKYLKSLKQKWVEDPSNFDTRYKRVRIRNLKKLTKKLELSNVRLCNTIDNMQRVRNAIDFFINELITKSTIEKDSNYIALSTPLIYTYPEEIVIRALAKLLQDVSGKYYPARFDNLLNLYRAIMSKHLGKGMTLSHCKISFHQGLIRIEKERTRGKKTAGKN